MDLSLTVNFGLILYLLLSIIDLFLAFDPNVRFHEEHNNQRFNYSYVNLKKIPGHKLNVVPYTSITVKNQSLCIKECLKTNGICQSINLKTVSVDVHECEILSKDIYTSELIQQSDYNHYLVKVCTCHFITVQQNPILLLWLQENHTFLNLVLMALRKRLNI